MFDTECPSESNFTYTNSVITTNKIDQKFSHLTKELAN